MASAMLAGVRGSGGMAESPRPGMSGTHSSKRGDSTGMVLIQCVHEPVPPCSSSSGSPVPHTRQTMLPSPQGVRSLRAERASASTMAAGSCVAGEMSFGMRR